MLIMNDIVKNYQTGDEEVPALKGISIKFRNNEFVSILGPSGCGKTTLLNIIGGLDRYTSGDLIINGVSTKEYKDADWDTYRNHSIGFVFQSYNLIPHQTVLSNVELALTLSGVSKNERRKRAIEALQKVGLGDQINKKPNQMSGGQMQRVAIARALVNNPDILLADEPTGALDTTTSVQIMDILKEVAKDKLVIMVTHNPELAEAYSTRIIRVKDGLVVDDTDPCPDNYVDEKKVTKETPKAKKTSLSFFAALNLSLKNLMTKRARTILVSFAGSIGIIGIALILSLSNGITIYINKVQEDTLSTYPLTLEQKAQDYSGLMAVMLGNQSDDGKPERDPNKIYVNNSMTKLVNAMNATTKNDLKTFNKYLQEHKSELDGALTAIQYTYDFDMQIFSEDGQTQINPSTIFESIGLGAMMPSYGSNATNSFNAFSEMIDNDDLLHSQYDCVAGKWPTQWDEVVLVISKNNAISNTALYMLGLRDQSELKDQFQAIMNGESVEITDENTTFSFDDFLGMTFYIVPNTDFYINNGNTYEGADGQQHPIYDDIRKDKDFDQAAFVAEHGIPVKISGILRPNSDATASSISTLIAYNKELTSHMYTLMQPNKVIQEQLGNKDYDITTGLEFDNGQYRKLTSEQKKELFDKYLQKNPNEKATIMLDMLSKLSPEDIEKLVSEKLDKMTPAEKKADLLTNLPNIIEKDPEGFKTFMIAMMKLSLKPEEYESYAPMLEAMDAKQLQELMKKQGVDFGNMDMSEEDRVQFMALLDSIPQETIEQILTSYYVSQAESTLLEEIKNDYTTAELIVLFDAKYATMTVDEKAALYDKYMPTMVTDKTYEEVLVNLGYVDESNPKTISFYAKDFESKDRLEEFINRYNDSVEESERITYTDLVKLMMSSITTIINVITYVLVAFVAISLVVSSIMIGIITYISVLERTKEIGILRAIGASKMDVARVFNAETVIIGLCAGVLGILITLLLCIPINIVIRILSDISGIGAQLPFLGAIILIAISVVLTLIAGIIPSRVASKKDPVVALRSE